MRLVVDASRTLRKISPNFEHSTGQRQIHIQSIRIRSKPEKIHRLHTQIRENVFWNSSSTSQAVRGFECFNFKIAELRNFRWDPLGRSFISDFQQRFRQLWKFYFVLLPTIYKWQCLTFVQNIVSGNTVHIWIFYAACVSSE